ncbi:transcriptional regulator [Tumebacillus algifaecis]|uniref:Transcriptional regulator n=1 Tax=Tumebacillus algifaecis TaxID=1214604 RepID=A0A223D6J7_9BACL|nr:ParB N-terminal domain-containing protein [Tumebacillus algifaecis]ASS77219.1 transcriptional regulator [Tumebacillus algifaecis]
MKKLYIRTIPVEQINPAPYNPRRDLQPGDPEFEKLKRSMETYGYVDPLIWNKRTGNLVGGHQRFKVLVAAGATEVDVSVVDLDDSSEKALNITLNKVSGDWDDVKLASLLDELRGAGFEIALTGFNDTEADKLIAQFQFGEDDRAGDFENGEINLGSFDDDNFDCQCPRCGFSFNPKKPVTGDEGGGAE